MVVELEDKLDIISLPESKVRFRWECMKHTPRPTRVASVHYRHSRSHARLSGVVQPDGWVKLKKRCDNTIDG